MEENTKKEFEELYSELYESWENIRNSNNRRKVYEGNNVEYTRFTAMQGYKYNEEKEVRFLLVGRAVNGWGEYFGKDDSKESFVKSSIANLINDKKSFSKNNSGVKDRFEWIVTEKGEAPHNTFRDGIDKEDERNERGSYKLTNSPFWNYTKEIFDKLHKSENSPWDDRWFEKIAWTNLYKVAPTGKNRKNGESVTWGANPNTTECKKQIEVCKKLLKAEIDYFDPTHILMVVGEDWFSDFEEIFYNVNDIGRNVNSGEQRPKEGYINQISDYLNSKK